MSFLWVCWSVIKIENWVDRNSFFLLNIISWACVVRSRLNFILNWKANSLFFSWSWLRPFAKVSISWTTEKKDGSSANNLDLLLMSFDKFLIYIKNNKVPKGIFVVHQHEYQPETNADHLKRLLAFFCLGSPLKY